VPKIGVGFRFGVVVFRKVKSFDWGWFCKSAVLVGKEQPNKPVQAERPSEVFIVAGV
jgi:hypothetical protein